MLSTAGRLRKEVICMSIMVESYEEALSLQDDGYKLVAITFFIADNPVYTYHLQK